MPIYEYRCEKCGDFERTQRITDPPLQRCPQCRRKVRRLISSTSFQLKGSGWYVTDYARAGAKKNGSTDGGSGSEAPAAEKSKDTTATPAKATSSDSSSSKKSAESKGASAKSSS